MDDEEQVNHRKLVTVLFGPLQALWSRCKEMWKYTSMNKNTYKNKDWYSNGKEVHTW